MCRMRSLYKTLSKSLIIITVTTVDTAEVFFTMVGMSFPMKYRPLLSFNRGLANFEPKYCGQDLSLIVTVDLLPKPSVSGGCGTGD